MNTMREHESKTTVKSTRKHFLCNMINVATQITIIILTRGENPSPPTEPSDLPFQPQFPQLNFDELNCALLHYYSELNYDELNCTLLLCSELNFVEELNYTLLL